MHGGVNAEGKCGGLSAIVSDGRESVPANAARVVQSRCYDTPYSSTAVVVVIVVLDIVDEHAAGLRLVIVEVVRSDSWSTRCLNIY